MDDSPDIPELFEWQRKILAEVLAHPDHQFVIAVPRGLGRGWAARQTERLIGDPLQDED